MICPGTPPLSCSMKASLHHPETRLQLGGPARARRRGLRAIATHPGPSPHRPAAGLLDQIAARAGCDQSVLVGEPVEDQRGADPGVITALGAMTEVDPGSAIAFGVVGRVEIGVDQGLVEGLPSPVFLPVPTHLVRGEEAVGVVGEPRFDVLLGRALPESSQGLRRVVVAADSGRPGYVAPAQTARLSRYLQPRTRGLHYELASSSPAPAGPLIVRDARPVMMLTRPYGRQLTPPATLAAAVASGQLRYALIASSTCRRCTPSVRWAIAHGTDVSRAGAPAPRLALPAAQHARPSPSSAGKNASIESSDTVTSTAVPNVVYGADEAQLAVAVADAQRRRDLACGEVAGVVGRRPG